MDKNIKYINLCPNGENEPDSNIVEYAEDVKNMIALLLIKNELEEIYVEKLPF